MTEDTKSSTSGSVLSDIVGSLRKSLITQFVPAAARNAFLSLLGTKVQTLIVDKNSDSNFRNSLEDSLRNKTLDIRATYGVVRSKTFNYLAVSEGRATTFDEVVNGWWLVNCGGSYVVIRKCNLFKGDELFNTTVGLLSTASSTNEIFSGYILYYRKNDPSGYEYLVNKYLDELREFRKNRPITVYTLVQRGNSAIPDITWCHKVLYTPNWNEKCPIIIPEMIRKNLIEDAALWKERAQWYRDRRIPYQRSYLLDGPPGSGKSTLIPELAFVVGMDVYLLNLSMVESDAHLDEILSRVRSGILVIEDADSFEVLRSRTAPPLETAEKERNKTKITLSGFLNAINGVATEDNRIIVYTTNHSAYLDPAVTRSGRVDRTLSVGPLQHTDIVAYGRSRYVDWVTPEGVTFKPTKVCDLQRYLIESGDDVCAFISRLEVEKTQPNTPTPAIPQEVSTEIGNNNPPLDLGDNEWWLPYPEGSSTYAPYKVAYGVSGPARKPSVSLVLHSSYLESLGLTSTRHIKSSDELQNTSLPKGGTLYGLWASEEEAYRRSVGATFYLEVGSSGSGIYAPYVLSQVKPVSSNGGVWFELSLYSDYMKGQGRPKGKRVRSTDVILHSSLPEGGRLYKRSDKV